MGTGFSIDTPLRVAKYGISSVISLVDDVLIEQVRKFHCHKAGEPYEEIDGKQEDARAKRITAYLNLVDRLVKRQVDDLRASPFEPGSEITRYFEMLPRSSRSRQTYDEMLACMDPDRRAELQEKLRKLAVPGSIDVNIMTKLDCARYRAGKKLSREFNDGMAALRGYAKSTLQSAIVFSAGMNQQLYRYATQFKDFFCDETGLLKKKIILKVTDHRSAFVQGKLFARMGLWVSEFRVESGLNCGGHTFPGKGLLLGPILEELRKKKEELVDKLHEIYNKALKKLNMTPVPEPHEMLVTVQGGIGNATEDRMLREHYRADGTGWATPFMLTPEVTNLDDEHRRKLCLANDKDVYLSDSSPVGVPFWNLRSSASEQVRRERIESGRPGSPCPKSYLNFTDEFGEPPICRASRRYQKQKLEQLARANLSYEERAAAEESVLAKSCICHDLGGNVTRPTGIDPDATSAVCPGPNIAYFSKTTTLEEMIDHIYGRVSLLADSARPHMFIQEMSLYVEFLNKEIERVRLKLSCCTVDHLAELRDNLLESVAYYTSVVKQVAADSQDRFLEDLRILHEQIEAVSLAPQPATA